MTQILQLDIAGLPIKWVSREYAATLYCKDLIAWEAGEDFLRISGGVSRMTGKASYLDLNTIVAVRGKPSKRYRRREVPPLTNDSLFHRDDYTCMYCSQQLSRSVLTRDHVHPVALGGKNRWENVVTACKPCNARKDCMTPKQAEDIGMKLLAIPYTPNMAEGLILENRRILADQMGFLVTKVGKESRFRI